VRKRRQQPVKAKKITAEQIRAYPSGDDGGLSEEGLSKEEIEKQGYSELTIKIRIHPGVDRPFMTGDMSMDLDGHPLKGIAGIEVKANPPHCKFEIQDPNLFQQSTNHGGFFWTQGIYFTTLHYGAGYPAIKCGKCGEGIRYLQYGYKCDNPECDDVAIEIKSRYLQLKDELDRRVERAGFKTLAEYINDLRSSEDKEDEYKLIIRKFAGFLTPDQRKENKADDKNTRGERHPESENGEGNGDHRLEQDN
jgi:hypothetical protein